MKKFLVVLLALAVAGGAFAQLKATVSADFNTDLLKIASPTGDAADKDKTAYAGTGSFNFLTAEAPFVKNNELRLALNYTGEGYSGYLRLKADSLVVPAAGFFSGGGDGVKINDVFATAFDEFNIQGTVGKISGYVGNTGDRGKVNRFQNFDDPLKNKVDNYGILIPTISTTTFVLGFNDSDTNNLQRAHKLADGTREARPYLRLSTKFDPITVAIAGTMGTNTAETAAGPNTASYNKVNGAFRVSGEKIADMLTFDLIYKFHGDDPDTDDKATGKKQPDGKGRSYQTFGLYGNLAVVDNLGIGFGYSGLFQTVEDADTPAGTVTTSTPFFSGIDLRFQYTGVEKLTITFNNNISFAGAKGESDAKKVVYGLMGALGEKDSESWFALYNALGFNYLVTDQLRANLWLANRMGSASHDDGTNTQKLSTNDFTGAVVIQYNFNSHVILRSGLELRLQSWGFDPGSNASNWGTFSFDIPIRFTVVY